MSNFRVNILGCSSATQSSRHQQSSQVVDFRDKLFMIDCGEGAQGQFRKQGLKFSRLGHIFISHLHGDHFFGLPGLLSTMSLHEISGTVTIHLFRRGAELLDEWMKFFNRSSSFEIVYDIIEPGERRTVYEDGGLIISTFPLYHRIDCTGYLFQEKQGLRHLRGDMVKFHNVPVSQLKGIKEGRDFVKENGVIIPNHALTTDPTPARSYAYCSDTMANPAVATDVLGVGTMYHEATYDATLTSKAHERGHSTAREAAEAALDARAGQLILGHFSKRYDAEGEQLLLQEAREIFPNTILAYEGLMVDVKKINISTILEKQPFQVLK
ncbi:MAG: ribonuclease Z [Muribaculaceae bacterium]|nr:ribonuclease Z [Muribaculaceae bacterium]